MFRIEETIEISAPAQRVSEVLARPENDAKWQAGIVHLELKAGNAGTPGATYERVQEIMGRKIKTEQRLEAADDERRVAYSLKGKIAELQSTFTLAGTSTATRVTWALEGELTGFAAMFENVLRDELKAAAKPTLARLKTFLER